MYNSGFLQKGIGIFNYISTIYFMFQKLMLQILNVILVLILMFLILVILYLN